MALTLAEEKPIIANFLSQNPVGVLATCDKEGQPHAATIYFIIDPEFNFYFITKEDTTKFHNLTQNPQAALAVYEASTQTTVQITGTASLVTDDSRTNDIFRRMLNATAKTSESAIPPVSKISGGEYKCFCIHPKTVRLAEYTKREHSNFDDIFDVAMPPGQEL